MEFKELLSMRERVVKKVENFVLSHDVFTNEDMKTLDILRDQFIDLDVKINSHPYFHSELEYHPFLQ